MIRILVVGISYKTASVDIREGVSFPENLLEDALLKLHSTPSIKECCIISTCNRVEVYTITDDHNESERELISFITEFNNQFLCF